MTITVLDPVQQALAFDDKDALSPAPRPDTLNGKVLGLWHNDKTNARLLLELMREELEKHYSFTVLRGIYDPGNLMPDDGWGEIDKCDVVLLANGDCGACSTSGIVNAIELEKRGLPTMLTATPPFTEAVKTSAELRGMPSIKWAIVDHPIASLREDELRERAIEAVRQFPALMLAPAQQQKSAA